MSLRDILRNVGILVSAQTIAPLSCAACTRLQTTSGRSSGARNKLAKDTILAPFSTQERTYSGSGVYPGSSEAALVTELRLPSSLTNMFATGVNYRLAKRHNVMMDLQWRNWDEDVENIARSYNMRAYTKTQDDFVASVGYQRDGSSLYYDPFWDRVTYRAGAWFKNWYVADVYEVGGSVGAGFPLGRKGISLDLAIQGGKRFSESDGNWDEVFLGIRLGLMGIGNWGQTRK